MVVNQKQTLGLALLIATTFALAEATVTKTSIFDSYIGVVDKLPLAADRLRVLEAVWGEIRADGFVNLTQVKQFHDIVATRVLNPKVDEAEEASELLVAVREVLIADNGRLLAETLNNNKSQTVQQVINYRKQLLDTYSEELLQPIFEHAINILYPVTATDVLWQALQNVDTNTYASAQRVYNVRVHWNLYLYWKFMGRGDINDAYIYNASQALHNFRRESWYKNLPTVTVRRIDNAFNSFIPSLRHLFNTSAICLSNENFMNYYLYFASSVAGSATTVQAVLRNAFFEHTIWRNSYGAQTTPVTGNFYLSTMTNNWQLYRRTPDYAVVVQRTEGVSANKYWTPSLRNNHIMFENNGLYMCATADYVNNLGGFGVKALKINSLDDTNCLWTITNCSELH